MGPSAGLSGGEKDSVQGMQGCGIAGPDPKSLCYDRCLSLNPDWTEAGLEKAECEKWA